jgi:hypothetical protein
LSLAGLLFGLVNLAVSQVWHLDRTWRGRQDKNDGNLVWIKVAYAQTGRNPPDQFPCLDLPPGDILGVLTHHQGPLLG